MYEDLIKRLINCISDTEDCAGCPYQGGYKGTFCMNGLISEAADAIEAQDRHILTLQHEMMAEAESHIAEVNRLNKQIEELKKVASAMHTWIFLNTEDEQKAYDECGLSDEMNAALGYSGQFVAELPKEE